MSTALCIIIMPKLKKHCTLARKTSRNVYLKDVAQAKSLSLLFPEHKLVWEHPIETDELLLLDISINPLQFGGDLSWVQKVPVVRVMPGTKKVLEKILKREVQEVVL